MDVAQETRALIAMNKSERDQYDQGNENWFWYEPEAPEEMGAQEKVEASPKAPPIRPLSPPEATPRLSRWGLPIQPLSWARSPWMPIVVGMTLTLGLVAGPLRAISSAPSSAGLPPQMVSKSAMKIAQAPTPEAAPPASNAVSLDQVLKGRPVRLSQFYTVQVGAFRDRKVADKITASYRDKGYKTFVASQKRRRTGVVWHQVCIGRYPTRKQAVSATLALRKDGYPDAYIALIGSDHKTPTVKSLAFSSHRGEAVQKKSGFVYTVQVGAFQQDKLAQGMVYTLRGKGFDPYIIEAYDNKGQLWKTVCMGRFKKQEEADAWVMDLGEEGVKGGRIMSLSELSHGLRQRVQKAILRITANKEDLNLQVAAPKPRSKPTETVKRVAKLKPSHSKQKAKQVAAKSAPRHPSRVAQAASKSKLKIHGRPLVLDSAKAAPKLRQASTRRSVPPLYYADTDIPKIDDTPASAPRHMARSTIQLNSDPADVVRDSNPLPELEDNTSMEGTHQPSSAAERMLAKRIVAPASSAPASLLENNGLAGGGQPYAPPGRLRAAAIYDNNPIDDGSQHAESLEDKLDLEAQENGWEVSAGDKIAAHSSKSVALSHTAPAHRVSSVSAVQQASMAHKAISETAATPARRVKAGKLFQVALEAKRNGDNKLQEQRLRQVLMLDSGHSLARQYLARLLLGRGQVEEAVAILEAPDRDERRSVVAKGDPKRAEFLAALYQRVDRHWDAIDLYESLLKQNQNGLWWMGMAISLERVNEPSDALQAYRKALTSKQLTSKLRSFVEKRVGLL
ncbi:MAG: SPOR domain-containing protein [Magnetococcales bacterium]|nr:SPOR domain-containing protein [Magnetococcales bacterium]